MGREATKAYGNVWFEARKNAAKYDDRLSSRDGAAELLGMSVSSVADTELGLLKCMPPDKAVLMADLYNAPHLLNYYCKHECPIGRNRALRCETVSICSSAYRLLQALDSSKVESAKDLLMNSIGDEEIVDESKFRELVKYMDSLSVLASELRMHLDILDGGKE